MDLSDISESSESVVPKTSLLARLPLAADRPLIGHGIAILLTLIALFVRQALDDSLPPGFPYLTFFPAVILSAFFFGLRPGITASVLSGLAAWYFFIEPVNSLTLGYASAIALAFFIFIVIVDISLVHWMQRANYDLQQERLRSLQLAENRSLLFQELQHRVGNNLQMVGSLLSLQKRQVEDDQARALLEDAANRVAAIGRVQRNLYRPHGEQLGLHDFIDQVCRDAISALGRADVTYSIAGGTGSRLHPDKAIPTALVMTEALNNAVEHGFGNHRGGRIGIEISREEDRILIELTDDGVGLPSGFDMAERSSLGLRIATTLARSMGGEFTVQGRTGSQGTLSRLAIPIDERAAA
jgi:two-component sensor histidine kinase